MNTVPSNSFRAWVLAMRPKTLTGALIPILIAASLAMNDGCFRLIPALLCMLFACGMQIAANFINDLYDFLKGSDREDRLGPERACSQGWITPHAMRWGIVVAIAFSCLMGIAVLYEGWSRLPFHGLELIALGLLCILFAFLYTLRLSYWGWGDALVLLFFGFVPVCGTYYVLGQTVTLDVVAASLVCGLAIDALLIVNNYRDREQDAVSGKCTVIVRLGKTFGQYLYLCVGILAALTCLWFVHSGKLTLVEFLWAPCTYLYLHLLTWRKMVRIDSGKKLNSILGETSRNMLLLGLLLSLALAA